MSYTQAQEHAIKKFVELKQLEFNGRLKKLISEAIPLAYENPLGQVPREWDDVFEQMSRVHAENMRTRAETHLTSKMMNSMLDELQTGMKI